VATLFATTKKELLLKTGKEALAKTEEGITGRCPYKLYSIHSSWWKNLKEKEEELKKWIS